MGKSYNPFKMWGSYVVFGILILLFVFYTISDCDSFFQVFNLGGPNCYGFFFGFSQFLSIPMFPALLLTENLFLAIVFYIIFGFLIGWGIHSLARKLKK